MLVWCLLVVVTLSLALGLGPTGIGHLPACLLRRQVTDEIRRLRFDLVTVPTGGTQLSSLCLSAACLSFTLRPALGHGPTGTFTRQLCFRWLSADEIRSLAVILLDTVFAKVAVGRS